LPNSTNNTPTPQSPTPTTEGPTTTPPITSDMSQSSDTLGGRISPTPAEGHFDGAKHTDTSIVSDAIVGHNVTIVSGGSGVPVGELSPVPVPGEQSPLVNWAWQQPRWPTLWPPPWPVKPQPTLDGGFVPWLQWIENLATRPFATDPPPCPVVVSYYGWPPRPPHVGGYFPDGRPRRAW